MNSLLPSVVTSVLSNKKPRKPRTPKLSNSGPKLSKKVLSNIESLSIYNSFNPLNQGLIIIIQDMYKSRDITNIKTAKIAIDALTVNEDFNKFKTLFSTITKNSSNKTRKSKY